MFVDNRLTPRATALEAVKRVELDHAYVDIVLRGLPEKMPVKDRAFVSELTRGTIRWKKRLDWITRELLRRPDQKLVPEIRFILWTGLYQIIFMRVPAFAAVNESVDLSRNIANGRYAGLVNGVLRHYIRRPQVVRFPDPKKTPDLAMAVEKSFPRWMVQRWMELWGADFTALLCDALNETPKFSFRVNRNKISAKEFEELMQKNNIQFQRTALPFYYVSNSVPYALQSRWLDSGLMTIQDTSAGFPAVIAGPEPDRIIADVCAAPGGKSLHLAELSENRALVLSADVRQSRVGLIDKARQKTDARIFPLVADAKHFPCRFFDTVLLDVPCSGLGVLNKKTDMRWKRQPKDIDQLTGLQFDLLCTVAELVKKDGCIVYSTCTLEPRENEEIVEKFLQQSDFRIDKNIPLDKTFLTENGMVRTWPHLHGMDGSFVVKLCHK